MLTAHLYLNEDQMRKILEHLPDEDKLVRPTLQEAGENIFRWNR